jgi:hypothetical protein
MPTKALEKSSAHAGFGASTMRQLTMCVASDVCMALSHRQTLSSPDDHSSTLSVEHTASVAPRGLDARTVCRGVTDVVARTSSVPTIGLMMISCPLSVQIASSLPPATKHRSSTAWWTGLWRVHDPSDVAKV